MRGEVVRLVVADDHWLVYEAILGRLEVERFEIAGWARRGSQVLPLVGQVNPDAVLLEFDLPELDGVSVIKRLRNAYPAVVPIVLARRHGRVLVEEALAAGAHAVISKAIEPALLGRAIRGALQQPVDSPIGVPGTTARRGIVRRLTEREINVLRLAAEGNSNKRIGDQLSVSEHTVKFHLSNAYRKIGVANRTEAAIFARRQGLLDLDDSLVA
jgi:DNA-binding NarL/FixJ family response regulator